MSLDLAPGIYHGVLVEVVEAEGTGLVGDHALGATTLTVAAGGFRDAGMLRIDGETYAYTRLDDILTITPGLVAAAEDGTPVESLTPAGAPESQTVAVVDLDMTGEVSGEDLPRAWIPGELAGFYPLGAESAGAMVSVEDTTYGYRVVGRPTDAPLFDGAAIDTSTLPPMPGGQTISDDAPTDTTGYPEDYGWWQVDADGKVLGFWRLVGGVWTPSTVVTQEALQAGNILADAINATDLTGVNINGVTITGADVTGTSTITGALYRTRLTGDRVAIGPLITNPDYTSVRFEADNADALTSPTLSGTDNTSQDATLLLDTGERAAVALPLGRTKRAWVQLVGQSVSGANTTRATVAANEILLRGHTSSTTVVTIDGAMGNGSVGTGTFRTSVDARATAVSAARMQTGTLSTGTLVAATATTIVVTYPTAFTGTVPKVNLTIVSGAGNERRAYVLDGTETLTGFSASVWRATGTASFDVNWLAVKP